jgi:ABC-type glutathione transport system ATPase component
MENKTEHKKVNTFHYNTKDLETMINNALANLKIQEFNFIGKDTTNDDVFNLLINNEKEELLKFFNSNKPSFINSLPFNNKINSSFKEQVSALIYTENAIDVYSDKIKQEISKISKNKNEFEIQYLTVMLVGKSGVGKSTLINGILKGEYAKGGIGKFQTIKTESYQSKNLPIFRLLYFTLS